MTAYEILGIPPASDIELIHDRYLELAWEFHPDRTPEDAKRAALNAERFKVIGSAWSELKFAPLRARYDAKLRMEKKICTRCEGEGKVGVFRAGKFRRGLECPECKGKGLK